MLVLPFGFLAPSAGALPDIVTDSLEQWFAPEAASDMSEWVVDQSGNGRDGTVGGAEWSWAEGDYAAITSGTSTSNVITTNYKPDMSAEWTFQVWINVVTTSGVSGDADCGILHNLQDSNSLNALTMRARRTDNFASTVFASSGGAGAVNMNVNLTGFWNSWQCATLTYDPVTEGCKLYWGTTLKATNGTKSMTSGKGTTMWLAGLFDGNSSNYFTEVYYGAYRVYTKYLNSTEITQNYDAEKAHYGL